MPTGPLRMDKINKEKKKRRNKKEIRKREKKVLRRGGLPPSQHNV
jgi:hypothetical protein